MSGYIPSKDVDLVPWADNFSALITAAPAAYALTAGDATTISDKVTAYDDAYAIAVNPTTRTPATIANKDSAKGAMVPILREYAQFIKNNTGISNELKVGLGIHINDTGPTVIPPPTSIPRIGLTGQFHLTMKLDIRATETPTTRAHPSGTVAAILFRQLNPLTDPAPTDPTLAPFLAMATANLFDTSFDSADVGKRCTFWCRWTNRKGELGPWSTPFSQVVA